MAKLLPLIFLIVACGSSGTSWPEWAMVVSEHLRCGMSLEEVQALTEKSVQDLGGEGPYGTHRIQGILTAVNLGFEDGELQSYSLSKVDGWRFMSTRLSPRHNLCGNDLTFFLRIVAPAIFDDAVFFIDEERIQSIGGVHLLSTGPHELRVEMPGYLPLVRTFTLEATDRGDQRIDLSDETPVEVPQDSP